MNTSLFIYVAIFVGLMFSGSILITIKSDPRPIDAELEEEAWTASPECAFLGEYEGNNTDPVIDTDRIYTLQEIEENGARIRACHEAVVKYIKKKKRPI